MSAQPFDPQSRVLVQGINEPLGAHYAAQMQAYGTPVVAGTQPGWGGGEQAEIPVFDLVAQAIEAVGPIETSLVFAHPYWVLDAALEAIAAGIRQIVLVTGGVPPLDLVRLFRKAEATQTLLLGPGSAGTIRPNSALLGTSDPQFYQAGSVGIISRSNGLTNEVARQLSQAGLGQSLALNLGTDALYGSSFRHWLSVLEQDPDTKAIVLVGQPGSGDEEAAAAVAAELTKPVFAYVPGARVKINRRSGEATAIVAARLSVPLPETSTAKQKVAALERAQVTVAKQPSQLPQLLEKTLKERQKKK